MNEDVKFILDVDATGALSAIRGFQTRVQRMRERVRSSLAAVGAGFRRLLSPIRAIGARLRWLGMIAIGSVIAIGYKLVRGVVSAQVEYETLSARLETIAGSAKKAGEMMRWAFEFAKTTPFELGEVIDAMVRLRAYGLEPMSGQLRIIGDFASAMGRRMIDAVEGVADAVMGEWERMKEFGIKREMLEEWMAKKGMPGAFAKGGQTTDVEAMKRGLFGMMAERGAKGMARMMDTIAGKWSNLRDAIWRFYQVVGARLAPVLTRILGGFTNVLNRLQQSGVVDKMGKWIEQTFSRENIEKAARFFAHLLVWGRDVFGWLGKTMATFGKFAAATWETLIEIIGGEEGLLGAIKKVGKALLAWHLAQVSIQLTGAIAAVIGTLARTIKHPLAVAAAATGLIYAGLRLYTSLSEKASAAQREIEAAAGMKLGRLTAVVREFPGLPDFGGALPGGMEAMVQGFMSAWDQSTQEQKQTEAAEETAKNTATIAKQNERVIDRIFGLGPRGELLTSRLLFGRRGPENININVNMGSGAGAAEIGAAVGREVGRALRVPRLVDAAA